LYGEGGPNWKKFVTFFGSISMT